MKLTESDWALRRPCGCVESVMYAARGRKTYAANEADAWWEFFDGKATRKRERELLIEIARRDGYRVDLMPTHEAVAELMKQCGHEAGAS